MSGRTISRKQIRVSVEKDLWRSRHNGRYCASYDLRQLGSVDKQTVHVWATSADEAREAMVRELVTKGFIDPRPASKGGCR